MLCFLQKLNVLGRIVTSKELEGLSVESRISMIKEIESRKNKTIDVSQLQIILKSSSLDLQN